MDTNRLRYFLSLAKTGSITRAADLHHISAAAFSKAMKVFEGEVGETLTVPQGRGLILTDQALRLVPKLEQIILQIDQLRDKKTANQQKVLKIATFEVFSTYFLSKALSSDALKDYECEVHELIPGKMEAAVATHKADLALTYLPIPHPDLDFMKIAPIEMGIYATREFTESKKHDDAFAAPVSPIEGSPNKVQGLDGWPDDAFPRNIKYRVEMLQTALNLCSEGQAQAYLPKFVARLYNETVKPSRALQEQPLPPKFPKTKDAVYLIKRKSDEEGELAKKLAQAVRKLT